MKRDFGKIKKKIFFKIILSTFLTSILGLLIALLLIDGALQEPFADLFIKLTRRLFQVDQEQAINVYRRIFWNNKQIIMTAGFIAMLLVFIYFGMTKFTRYFDEIGEGVNELTDETEQPIHLSSELKFMEDKLNSVKNTLKERTTEAEKSEQRKNDLVVYLAHDLKTPLTSVIGYLSLLSEIPDMPETQREKYTSIALTKAYRLESLINEFFEITRFNSQTIVLNKERINLNLLLEQMADEFYPTLEQKNLSISLETDADLLLYADPEKIARVFNNLLKNACAYSFENTQIRIAVQEVSKGLAEISFQNHGKRIPKEALSTIFEKFYRLDSARSSFDGGSGLGLAIAKEIVELHCGSIRAESNEEFTRFLVTLPCEHAGQAAGSEQDQSPPSTDIDIPI